MNSTRMIPSFNITFYSSPKHRKINWLNERRHYTDSFCVWQHSLPAISSRAFLKKIKVAALILSVCRCVFASVSVMADRSLFAVVAAVLFPDSNSQQKLTRSRESAQKHQPRSITADDDEILWVPPAFYSCRAFSRGLFALAARTVRHFVVFPANFEMMVALMKFLAGECLFS